MSFKDLTTKQLEQKIKELSDNYYNGEESVDDVTFDNLVDLLRKKNPKSKILREIGAPIRDDMVKVNLPIHMGSMDKIKEGSTGLDNWIKKFSGPYLLSAKLDGVSGLLEYKNKKIYLYTRGDGSVGQDISYLSNFLNLPPSNSEENFFIRGEFAMKTTIFNNYYAKDYPKARSIVSGVINSKSPRTDVVKRIDFIAYELITSPYERASQQFYDLIELGFIVPEYDSVKNFDSEGIQLTKKLELFRKKSVYDIDGVIVTNNQQHARNIDGNPKYSFAFKVNIEFEASVEDVIWSPSKYGILIPRVKIKPILIQGDRIEYSSGFHAKFIQDNKLGNGAKIIITKAGDVIPYIVETTKPASKAKFPPVHKGPAHEYTWSKSGINIILVKPELNEEVLKKRLLHFFQTLEISYISEGMIKKFYDNGYTTIKSIYFMTREDLLLQEGIKDKLADKLYNSIHNVLDKKIPLEKLMNGSLTFGFGLGEKRFSIIINNCKDYNSVTVSNIIELEGFSDKTATQFVENVDKFNEFLACNDFLKPYKISSSKDSGKEGKNVVFTGFRDKGFEQKLKDQGWTIQSNVTKTTNLVIAKNNDTSGSKISKAKSLNIKIVNFDEFSL